MPPQQQEMVMPFTEPYREYQKGDFLFGIVEVTRDFQSNLSEDLKESPEKALALSRKPTTVRELSLLPVNVNDKFTGDRLALNTSYLTALGEHPKYHRAHNVDTQGKDAVTQNSVFRAKSKEGLNYCISNSLHLHFLLDQLDLTEVMAKSRTGEYKTTTEKIRTVTGAELRWIYRNRTSAEAQTYVQFWIGGERCCPPWLPAYKTFVPSAPDWTYVPKAEVV
jgi:hypothetical protein